MNRLVSHILLANIRSRMLLYAITACDNIVEGHDASKAAAVAVHYKSLYQWAAKWLQ